MAQTNPAITAHPRVTVIDPRKPKMAKLRVAAYARVSSDSYDQINSYLAQVDFYTKYIASKEDWELADIYADEGISGLESRNRDEFNRMISDCRAGKIDLILVKSISRFARNTRDYIQYVRELLRLGVSIRFEKENIDTGKMSSEQIAQIYGAFAQMESTNHSSNMRFSIRMRMEKGLFVSSATPYGYRLSGRDLEIVPSEADVVRHIYAAYLSGQGTMDIANELNKLAVSRRRDSTRWHHRAIQYILTNISYTGDMLWQKSFSTDTIPFRKVINHGQKPRYFVESSHAPIISKEDFNRVQELMSQRREQFAGYTHDTGAYVYSKKIMCEKCGCVCRRKVSSGKTYWVCRRHDDAKANCPIPQIPEAEITSALLRLHRKLKQNGSILRNVLEQLTTLRERELRSNRKICDIDREIANISERNLVLVRLKSKEYVDSALYLSQHDELERQLKDLRKLRRSILDTAGEDAQLKATETMLDYLNEAPEWPDEVTPELFESLVSKILVASADTLKFILLNGIELTEQIERQVR